MMRKIAIRNEVNITINTLDIKHIRESDKLDYA
jgi:hypothetical protein